MTGLFVALRALRKPALALVAAAGLVAWSADAPVTESTGSAVSSIADLAHAPAPPLGQGAATGLLADSGERQHTRASGGTARGLAGSAAPAIFLRTAEAAAGFSPAGHAPHARSGRDAAPSTGPPTVLS